MRSYTIKELHNPSVQTLNERFSNISIEVTQLNFFENHLIQNTADELATAFASIPLSVTDLNLSVNELGFKTGTQLATILGSIPGSVTYLSLSSNELNNQSTAELAITLASIPPSVTHLDLSWNEFFDKPGEELATAFARIPENVIYIDLSGYELKNKTDTELAIAFASIRPGTTLSFQQVFYMMRSNHLHRDELLIKLRRSAPHLNIKSGESDFQRVLAPMACLMKKPVSMSGWVSEELMVYILSFLTPQHIPLPLISYVLSLTFNVILTRDSENDTTPMGKPLSIRA